MINAIKDSFVECNGRERVKKLLDQGTFRELLGPFDKLESPHLELQGIVPQSDDGVIIAQGTFQKQSVIVISMEGGFQGGGIGEVSGAKIAGALERALKDCKEGRVIIPIILFDSGGVRLQEANYGLLSIAEIQSSIVALRQHVPVVAVIPGKIGAFGGMAITAALCSSIIMTREGRLGLNGPEVIEQEAGIREFDSKDRIHTWKTIGGEQRAASGFADILIEDDVKEVREAIRSAMDEGSRVPKTEQITRYEALFHLVNPSERLTPLEVRELWNHSADERIIEKSNSEPAKSNGRGHTWFDLLCDDSPEVGELSSVRVADGSIGNRKVRYIAVVQDQSNPFPRVRSGEVGLLEGWSIAKHVWEAIRNDQSGEKRIIIPIVDVPSQAYGYNEELLGIHQACAAAANAYAKARMEGHPVIAFIPGKAISGAFLAHGMQSNRLIALKDEGVHVQVMSKKSAARITQRSLAQLEEITGKVPAMAYDIKTFETLGALYSLVEGVEADFPTKEDRNIVLREIEKAITDVEKSSSFHLDVRLSSEYAKKGRAASILVRKKLEEQWK